MADTFTKIERSSIMRNVKSSGNRSTELKLVKLFRENGVIGWRRNYPLFGKPDFTFPKSKVAVFVDGCFWHGHNCRNTRPSDNKEYWTEKINRNKKRDLLVNGELRKKEWKVVRIWECSLKKDNSEKIVLSIKKLITN